MWFCERALAAWERPRDAVTVGRPYPYSNAAIEGRRVLQELFRLPYRQTEGLVESLLKHMEADVSIADFTSLAKPAAKLNVALKLRDVAGPSEVVVDSTGLRVYGGEKWKVRTHGQGKRPTWRQLVPAMNSATDQIETDALTENGGHDADQVAPLLDRPQSVRRLERRQIQPIIPPRRNTTRFRHGNSAQAVHLRHAAWRTIRILGQRWWKVYSGYHRRSLAETASIGCTVASARNARTDC